MVNDFDRNEKPFLTNYRSECVIYIQGEVMIKGSKVWGYKMDK